MTPPPSRFRALAFLASMLGLTGCASLQPRDFAASPTRFEIDRYFTGHTQSWGVFEDRFGKPRRTFTADSHGVRDAAGDLVLSQRLSFSDGTVMRRVWHIHRVDATHWEATANDVVGTARGDGIGNAFAFDYTVALKPRNPLARVRVRQWIYQVEGTETVMTRLVITKFGITVAEVSESIHRVP